MNASGNGMDVTAEVVRVDREGMIVNYCGKEYRIDFDRYPYFRYCVLDELYHVEASAAGLHWPDADIDLELEYLEQPPADRSAVSLEWFKAQRRRALSRLGSAGGRAVSVRKAAAARCNGKKGGRPSKAAAAKKVLV